MVARGMFQSKLMERSPGADGIRKAQIQAMTASTTMVMARTAAPEVVVEHQEAAEQRAEQDGHEGAELDQRIAARSAHPASGIAAARHI